MLDFGATLASEVISGAVIYLSGPLGAGKTTLVRGFLRALGHQGTVKSPTYAIIEHYKLETLEVLHMDLYRLTDPEELSYLGIEDYLNHPNIVTLIEWPEQALGYLPPASLHLTLEHDGGGRIITLQKTPADA